MNDDTQAIIEPEEPKDRIKNPATGEFEKISELPQTGYKRRYLKLLREHRLLKNQIQNAVELDGTLTFDKDRWRLEDDEEVWVMHRKEWDSDRETQKLLSYRRDSRGGPA